MNKKAILLAVIYSVLVIGFKLFIWKSGLTFVPFYFKYAHILSVIAILPFMIFGIKWVRDGDNGGFIGGKEAGRIALTIFGISAIIISVYHYFEFKYSIDAFIEYYRGPEYLSYLEKDPKAKQLGYEKIIEFQISELSPFKATTGKLFPFVLLSASSAFICAVFMKKNPA